MTNPLVIDGSGHFVTIDGSGDLILLDGDSYTSGSVTGTWGSTEGTDSMVFDGTIPAVPPVFDSTFGGLNFTSGNNPTSFNSAKTQKTGGTDRLVTAIVSYYLLSGQTGDVSSITESSSTLTFTKQFSVQNTNKSNDTTVTEVWTAPATAVFNSGGSSLTWTVNFSSVVGGAACSAFAVSGVISLAAPFDTNSTLPASARNSTNTTAPVVTFSTQEAGDLLIGASVYTGGTASSTPGGWTDIVQFYDAVPLNNVVGGVYYKSVTSAQTNATFQDASAGSDESWLELVFAFTADNPPPPTGTWDSTEGTDALSIHGGVLGGAWYSTDTKDTFAGSNVTPIGTWASTETKDAMVIDGTESAPLSLDGSAEAGINGPVTSGTVTLTTTQANDVIVVEVVSGGFFNSSTVSSITDTAGLVWTKRNQRYRNDISHTPSIEIWWAHAPTALSGDVITVNFGAETGAAALIAFGVAGANYTTPWDTHTQAGGYTDLVGNNAFFPAQAQLYTNAGNAFLFGLHGDFAADAGLTETPWTYVTSAQGAEDDGFSPFGSFIYQIVDAPQAATNVPIGFSYAGGFVFAAQSVMFDSIVAFGQTGTTAEVGWYWDPSYANGTIALTSTNELVLNYSAMNENLMLLVQVLIQSASTIGEVASIDESQNLLQSGYHFQRRSRVVEGNLATEIWWAWMSEGVANNDTITINTTNTASGDVISAQMWGLGGTTGSYGLGDPFWDGNPSLPAVNSAAADSPPPNVTDMSTDTPSCLLVAWTANNSESEPGFVDPYITLIQDYPNTVLPIMQFDSSAPSAHMGFEFLYSATLAADETAEFLVSPEPVGWLMIGDAIPVGPPQPPTGVWASTEAKDKFTNSGAFDEIWTAAGWIGYVPAHCSMATSDNADEFTNAGRWGALGWVTGWIGFLSLFCTWHSTDNKDAAAFYAWLLGFGKITGQMNTTEHADYLSFSNKGPAVTGILRATESKDRLSANAYLIPKARPSVPSKRRLLIVT